MTGASRAGLVRWALCATMSLGAACGSAGGSPQAQVQCGGAGAVCCGVAACDPGLVCQAGTCQSVVPPACGADGEPCCGGSACDVGLTCHAATCQLPRTVSGVISGYANLSWPYDQPMAGVLVSLAGATGTTSVSSGGDGAYQFTEVYRGTYTVTAAQAGFASTPASVEVTITDADAAASFSLKPAVCSATTCKEPWPMYNSPRSWICCAGACLEVNDCVKAVGTGDSCRTQVQADGTPCRSGNIWSPPVDVCCAGRCTYGTTCG